ncbi:MAG: ATP-dependent Clp protease proteolytic subunit [Firmicutes bacterium]|nr:ATP-dependent Clp protease proteolytic subunit [Bacillota bacterium]
MVKRILVFLLLLMLLVPTLATVQAAEENQTVYVVPLEGAVEPGLYRFLQRSFAEANENGAAAIILELNTPGGLVNSATDIRELIYNSPVPVYAYVRYSALSAGAFLALACQEFYMAPGSTIGAAEIQTLSGAAVDEKTVSAWEAQMRTVAQNQGKDPQVAAAMVRQEIAIENLVTSEQLLTLTTEEAEEIGFTDGVFANRAALLAELGLAEAVITEVVLSPAERLARLVTHPAAATILITVGLAALVIEIIVAGFGVAGVVSILAFALYFGGSIIAGLAGSEVIVLFILGIVLLLIEAVVPNFGVIGLSGIIAIIASIVMSSATPGEGIRIFVMSLFLTILLVAGLFRYLKRSGAWSHIILQYSETKERGYVGPTDFSYLLGKVGQTVTSLRPSGAAEFDGERIDVISEGTFIPQSSAVKVVKVEGTRVVVRVQ